MLAVGVELLIAGPWYLRNWILTGNPIFPMFGLFTTGRSDAFHSFRSAISVILGGAYGMPFAPAAILAFGWLFAIPFLRVNPIIRACVIGVPLGFTVFFCRSPFPEMRFVLPVFLLLFACSGIAIQRLCRGEFVATLTGMVIFGCSLSTFFAAQFWWVSARFAGVGFVVALFGLGWVWWAKDRGLRWSVVGFTGVTVLGFYSYVYWAAYCRNYRQTMFDPDGGYTRYSEREIWAKVNELVPADATLAYTNMYLIYPLQGPALQRRLVYVPTRAGVKSIADLGWLGSNISGEQLVPASNRAVVQSADEKVWLENLRSSGAKYLVIGKGGVVGTPPEAQFVGNDPGHFTLLFDGKNGMLYSLKSIPY
jgi:hypothetical protein